MHPDTFFAAVAFFLFFALNLACVLLLRQCFRSTFDKFGLPGVARAYLYMLVFCVVSAAAGASELSNTGGDAVAEVLIFLPLCSLCVLPACLLLAARGKLSLPMVFLPLALLVPLFGVLAVQTQGMNEGAHGWNQLLAPLWIIGVVCGACTVFAFGLKQGERRAELAG